ncbi:hypothetical protein COBT_002020 [Conglomerata obtusa]
MKMLYYILNLIKCLPVPNKQYKILTMVNDDDILSFPEFAVHHCYETSLKYLIDAELIIFMSDEDYEMTEASAETFMSSFKKKFLDFDAIKSFVCELLKVRPYLHIVLNSQYKNIPEDIDIEKTKLIYTCNGIFNAKNLFYKNMSESILSNDKWFRNINTIIIFFRLVILKNLISFDELDLFSEFTIDYIKIDNESHIKEFTLENANFGYMHVCLFLTCNIHKNYKEMLVHDAILSIINNIVKVYKLYNTMPESENRYENLIGIIPYKFAKLCYVKLGILKINEMNEIFHNVNILCGVYTYFHFAKKLKHYELVLPRYNFLLSENTNGSIFFSKPNKLIPTKRPLQSNLFVFNNMCNLYILTEKLSNYINDFKKDLAYHFYEHFCNKSWIFKITYKNLDHYIKYPRPFSLDKYDVYLKMIIILYKALFDDINCQNGLFNILKATDQCISTTRINEENEVDTYDNYKNLVSNTYFEYDHVEKKFYRINLNLKNPEDAYNCESYSNKTRCEYVKEESDFIKLLCLSANQVFVDKIFSEVNYEKGLAKILSTKYFMDMETIYKDFQCKTELQQKMYVFNSHNFGFLVQNEINNFDDNSIESCVFHYTYYYDTIIKIKRKKSKDFFYVNIIKILRFKANVLQKIETKFQNRTANFIFEIMNNNISFKVNEELELEKKYKWIIKKLVKCIQILDLDLPNNFYARCGSILKKLN